MSARSLLDNFQRVLEAPDAHENVRSLILDLAVRGRLVEQCASEEPISALIEQIAVKRKQLSSAKREASGPDKRYVDAPFEIPSSWRVATLEFLTEKLGAGSTPLGGKSVYLDSGVPFLRSQNVYDDGLRLDSVAFISSVTHERMSGTHVKKDDLLLNITGASIGRCALVPPDFTDGNVSQHVAIIRLIDPAVRKFIHLALISPAYQKRILDVQVGVSREGLSMQRLKTFPMVLPPLAEQGRILRRVSELLALLKQVEAAATKRERRRDRLVAASLHALTNGDSGEGASPESFKSAARFYFNHLPRLTTRPEHVSTLRKTLLKMAVQGQLVTSCTSDQPVSALMDAIATKRTALEDAGVINRSSEPNAIAPSDQPFALPPSWVWARFSQVAAIQSNLVDPKDFPDAPHIAPDNIESGTGKLLPYETIAQSGVFSGKHRFSSGVILYSKIRPALAKAVVVDFDGLCSADMYPILPFIDQAFLHLYMLSDVFVRQSVSEDNRVAMPKINQAALSNILVPVPPLEEQKRIAAAVSKVTAILEELDLRNARNARLSSALLKSALSHALAEQESQDAVLQ